MMTMKGITPVIAVILLIMITISMVGFLFVWFSGFVPSILSQTEEHMTEQQRQMQMGVGFIAAYSDTDGTLNVSVRNTGTVEIKANELIIIVTSSGAFVGTDTYSSPILAGEIAPVWDTNIACSGDVEVKADIPGANDDLVYITC